MKGFKSTAILMLAIGVAFTACKKDEEEEMMEEETPSTTSALSLSIDGLADLGSDFKYEGWIMVNGTPQSTGTFSVDVDGNLSQSSFDIDTDDLDDATKFILTIEPSPDSDAAPSDVHIVAGDFSGNSSALSVGDPAALGDDFSTSTGTYILATPTDGADNNENSGVWWLDPAAGPGVGLNLPTLPVGWIYEGWAVINGTPVSTGTFLDPAMMDDNDMFSSTEAGPAFPGEDFIINAPSGLSFPTDLSGGAVVISVEPVPDNSTAPFLLKPLVGMVPADAMDHTAYMMGNNNTTNPTGTANR